jgi:hypothetical protein
MGNPGARVKKGEGWGVKWVEGGLASKGGGGRKIYE